MGPRTPIRFAVQIIMVVVAIYIATLTSLMCRPRGDSPRSCLDNVRDLARALDLYVTDYDETYPPPGMWVDSIHAYSQMSKPRCPAVRAMPGEGVGYAFNGAAIGRNRSDLGDLARLPLVFDSTVLRESAVAGVGSMPNPARHPEGNGVGFADGHAMYLKTR